MLEDLLKDRLDVLSDLLQIIVFVLAIIVFFRKFWFYLQIELAVDCTGNRPIAKTKVENKGFLRKRIDNAVLLIGPEFEGPKETYNSMVKKKACLTDDIAERRLKKTFRGNAGRAAIPLPFYYRENSGISDEAVTYSVPINTDGIPPGVPYSVRFFMTGEGRRHRSTHDCFTLP